MIRVRFEPRGDLALVRKEQGPGDLEPVRSQALHTQHGVAAIRPGAKIVTDAGLKVPPRVERTAQERLHFGALQTLAEAALTLGLEPEPVDIAAVPALRVPRIAVLDLADDSLELIDQDHADFDIAMFFANHFERHRKRPHLNSIH